MHAPALPAYLETERLLLRPVEEGDLEFYVELHGRQQVVRYLGGGGQTRARETTTEWLRVLQQGYAQHAAGQFAVLRRADSALIGRAGLSYFNLRNDEGGSIPRATWGLGDERTHGSRRSILEVGYVIHPDAWGQGFATEAAARWYAYALEERGVPTISSLIHPENVASRRVAEKNRLRITGAVLLDGLRYDWHQLERAASRD